MDSIFYNGRIYTMDDAIPQAQAVAVKKWHHHACRI